MLPNFDDRNKIHYGVIDANKSGLAIDIVDKADSIEYIAYTDYLEFIAMQIKVCRDFDEAAAFCRLWYASLQEPGDELESLLASVRRAKQSPQTAYAQQWTILRGALSDVCMFDDEQPQHYDATIDDTRYLYVSGEPYAMILSSRYVGYCNRCSPCYPNAGNVDELQSRDEPGLLTYLPPPDYLPDAIEIKAASIGRPAKWLDKDDWLPVLNHGDWFGKTWLVSVACGHFAVSAIVEADSAADACDIAAEHEEFGKMLRIEPPDTKDYTTVVEQGCGYAAINLDGDVVATAKTASELSSYDRHIAYTGDGRPYDGESLHVEGDEYCKVPYPVRFYAVQSTLPSNHVPCSVEWQHGALLVSFDDDRELFMQDSTEQAEFCYACGLFEIDESKGEKCAANSQGWTDCDPTQITSCPAEYWDAAAEEEVVQD